MKHFDERQKATKSCNQLKVACNYKLRILVSLYTRIHAHKHTCIIVYTYSHIHVSLYTHIQAHMYLCIHTYKHTCIIVYTNTCIPGSMYTAQGRRRQGTRRQGAQRWATAPSQGLITREGAGNFFGSWKLERELEIKGGAGIEAENKRVH